MAEITGKNDIFLSVIVAAYNVEPYAARCLDSMVSTGDPQVEVLVVLGNSKDRTNAVCREYGKRGLAVCIMQDGKGLSNARNCGIRRAQGTYLTFADADDWVDTERFAAFVRYLKKRLCKRPLDGSSGNNDCDVVINDFVFTDDSGRALFGNNQIGKLAKQSAHITEALVRSGGTFWNAWRYVYRTAYLKENSRSFLEDCCCEDLEFAVRTLLDTKRIVYLHRPYYYYCPVRPQSLMNAKDLKMLQDFRAVESSLMRLCAEQQTALAEAVAEKLKELLVLNLPDIWEVCKEERRAAILCYAKLMRSIKQPEKRWVRSIVYLCRMGGLVPVSYLLYRIRQFRRMIRYRTSFWAYRPQNSAGSGKNMRTAADKNKEIIDADYKDTVSCQLLRRRKRYGGFL